MSKKKKKSGYQKDEQQFNKSMETGNVDWANFQRLLLNDLFTNTKILETGYIGHIKLSDAVKALEDPKHHWRTILSVSESLMQVSPHYYRLNNLYSNMALCCWWVDLYDVNDKANVNTIKKKYGELTAKLEGMNLKHEFSKIMKVLPYQDIYCGLVFENQTDFFFQQIDYKICELYQIQDGLYNFRMNLSAISPRNLTAYPDYVQQAYLDYRDGKIDMWYEPPADKQICLKLNSQWTHPYPLLIGLVKDILDLDVYKKLKLQSARTDNYKAIATKVPIDESTVDKPLLTPDTLSVFAEINRESMSDDIGLLHTLGSDVTPISFKDSSNTRNNVGDSVDEIYNSAGVTKELFFGGSAATGVTLSIENSSGFVYGVYRQFERFINRWIKIRRYNKPSFKFCFYMVDITIFNRDNVSKRYRESIALGVTCIDRYLATLDMTPSRTLGSFITHHDIFDFNNNFIPLQTSYNSSVESNNGDGDGKGRPSNESKGEVLDEAGEVTEKNESNADR